LRIVSIGLVIGLGMLTAGCGGRPNGVLVPTAASAPGTSQVEMLVLTTRSDEGATPGEVYTGERGIGLSFAEIDVSIPPDGARAIGEVQWPSRLPGDPAKEFVATRVEKLTLDEIKTRFHRRVSKRKDGRVLLFVHGFNNRFEEAVFRFAQIMHDSKTPAVPLLFTWPSRAKLLAYGYDRESATYSRDALEAVLQALQKNPAVKEVNILAHSMGNWVTLEALRQMAIRDRRVGSKVRHVMLAAPDVDVDVARRQVISMGDKRPDFTLFVSRDDKALAVSRRVWGSTARLGAIDPKQEPARTRLEKAKIDVVDLSDVEGQDSLNHGKFAENEVVQLIGKRIAGGQALSDGGGGLGDKLGSIALGAATTVGHAATIAVAAPIAIVDGRTRENLGDRFGELGRAATDTVGSTGDVVTSAPGAATGAQAAP
jgi:esterase/lipase superfamily enzyme